MTREEAIARIKDHKIVHKMNEPRAIYISEALDMAIKALEQEPGDVSDTNVGKTDISRQAAIEKIHWLGIDNDTAIMCDLAIRALPSVTSNQRTGHWITISSTDMYCSECNEIEHLDTRRKFCAYCGTRMVEPLAMESEEISREEIAALLARESMSEKMTREQAIDYFRTQTAYLGGKDKQACEIAILAIAALSAEPCEDAISRQALLGLAYDMSEIDGEHFTEPCMVVDVEDIQKLPPVTPKQKMGCWIDTGWKCQTDTDEILYGYGCSECGAISFFRKSDNKILGGKWCHYCGTKMVEPQKSEVED